MMSLKEQLEMCTKAEKELVESIEGFIPYWKLVQDTKKQLMTLRGQKRYLIKEIEKEQSV